MPRLPFKLKMPVGAQTKISTEKKTFGYDANQMYIQMGSALRSSESAQVGFLRIKHLLEDALETKDLQDAALAERRSQIVAHVESVSKEISDVLAEIDDFERVLGKFELGKTRKIAQLLDAALQAFQASAVWFRKYLASHSEQEAAEYKPLADNMAKVAAELGTIRKRKVEDAAHMESAYDQKKLSSQRVANSTRPVKRRNLPYPAEPTPSVALDIREAIESAKAEIFQKEQLKKDKQ